MESYPKISIVTINLNQGNFLEQTIKSVLDQNYPNLEYIIIDGGSTDNSIEIIKRYANKITLWVSKPDAGMYYAVQKGFELSTGEIMAWINSDDYYVPGAFEMVAGVFENNPQCNWIQGLTLEDLGDGTPVNRFATPLIRWSRFRYLTNDFQFIHQESTFWRRKVWEEAGNTMDLTIKYAGDMELWARFFRSEKLFTVNAYFGVFRQREGQISKVQRVNYLLECKNIVKRELRRLGSSERFKIFLLQCVKFTWGGFYFLNIPILKLFYEKVFHIPHLLKTTQGNKHNFSIKRRFMFPPLVVGKWVIQRRILLLKP